MTSKAMRKNPLFMRNCFETVGKWDIPLVKRQELPISQDTQLISYSDTRRNETETNKSSGVHFFIDDYRFNGIYDHPERSLEKLSQYAFLLTPDYSTYADMDLWRQLESVAKNRWCEAYWQSKGRLVIPTISWSTSRAFEFFCDGVEYGSAVAIGMIGCKKNRLGFMRGYSAMLERINPSVILCFGEPFPEMEGNIFTVNYQKSRKVVR
ncbi:MAG: DUF4417 domain-containing protein [Butyrivibrio sp.]|nr:DUF4417 domain-containing protein [Butyrivibrio sp.]